MTQHTPYPHADAKGAYAHAPAYHALKAISLAFPACSLAAKISFSCIEVQPRLTTMAISAW